MNREKSPFFIAQVVLGGLAILILLACGGLGTQANPNRVQALDIYGEGTKLFFVAAESGTTFQADVVYSVVSPYDVNAYGPLADEVRFVYDANFFEPIGNLTINNQGEWETWTIPITVKDGIPEGTYPIRGALYSGGTLLTNPDTPNFSVNVSTPTVDYVARINVTPSDIRNNDTAMAELVLSDPNYSLRLWSNEGFSLFADPANITFPAGQGTFPFEMSSFVADDGAFARCVMHGQTGVIFATYEMFIHDFGPEVVGANWSGNLNGDMGGTATLSFDSERFETTLGNGNIWISNIAIDVIVDTSRAPMLSFREETDYPFQHESGAYRYRISIDGMTGGNLDVTVQEFENNVLVETYTGSLSS